MPRYAFSDTVAFSLGVKNRLGTRNAPSLLNVAYNTKLLRDGIIPSLEKQVTVPIHEHLEFDFNIVLLAERMNQDSTWVKMSMDAYGRKPTPFVISRALAAFQRTLISDSSPYDEHIKGNEYALTAQQRLGLGLFNGKANCSNCHSGLFFTNESLQNNGLYEQYNDSGKMRLTLLEEDRDLFKVPSLRNVGITSPYMHDGSISSLEGVLSHYNSGGKSHIQKGIEKLDLSKDEKEAIISFLHSLSDKKAISKYTEKYN